MINALVLGKIWERAVRYGSKIATEGRTTIPLEVRKHLDLKPGDGIVRDRANWHAVEGEKKRAVELTGMLHRPGMKPVTVREMDEAIADAVVEDDKCCEGMARGDGLIGMEMLA